MGDTLQPDCRFVTLFCEQCPEHAGAGVFFGATANELRASIDAAGWQVGRGLPTLCPFHLEGAKP